MTAPQQSDVQHHHQPPAAVPPSGGAFEDATSALAVVRLATPADAPTITAFNQATAWETESIRIPDDVARAGVDAMLLPGGEAQGNAWMYVLGEHNGPELSVSQWLSCVPHPAAATA